MIRKTTIYQPGSWESRMSCSSIKNRTGKRLRQGLLLLICSTCLRAALHAQSVTENSRDNDTPDTSTIIRMQDSLKSTQVQLLYQRIPRRLTAASSDAMYANNLAKYQVTNVANALPGRLTGLVTQQFSGQPFLDGVSLSLHGRSPIVLIDGVVRNFTTIDMGEIESVTLLKDAVATAMLGNRGANGALLITTKKGGASAGSISFTAQTAVQQPLGLPKTLHAYDYAMLRNEAIDNDLRVRPDLAASLSPLRYTAADLQLYKDGTDPYGHPDVDWQAQLFKKTSLFNRYSLNAGGSNSFSRYFVSLEHINQQGFVKQNDANKYNTNNWGKSYIARTNVDINITPKLSGGVSLFGRIINSNEPGGPGTGISGIYSSILTTPNNAYPVYNKDSSFAGNTSYTNNLQAQATGSGYSQVYNRDILADFHLKRTLDEILPGMWVQARLNYSSYLTENLTRTRAIVVYRAMTPTTYQQIGTKADQINTNAAVAQGRSSYIEFLLGYDHVFGNKHGLNVLLLTNQDKITDGTAQTLPYTIKGTSGKITYNYKEKYVLDAAFGLNGANRYNVDSSGGSTKYGFFPAVGAAWNISKEDFMQHTGWVSGLKLFASYGKTGWDRSSDFLYAARYGNTTQAYFGTAAGAFNTLTQTRLSYPGTTWEKANKLNIGLEGSLMQNRLTFSLEYYYNKFYDLLITRGQNTSLLGITYPQENIGENNYKGWDAQLSWQEKKGKFSYYISANATLLNSKVIYSNEVVQPYDYMLRTGNTVGRAFGYVADGLFQSQAEITGKATFAGYIPQPGDIRYKDLNNDAVINQLDQTAIGTDKPQISYGVSLGFSYQSFDVSALIQGIANRDIYLNGNGYYEFGNGGLGQAYQNNLDRWTPSNPGATYPRVGIGYTSNNQAFSSFWMRKGDYLRLKNAEIGYTISGKWANKVKLQSARIFANGLNLLTAFGIDGRDPEVYGVYPIQRLFNFGINIKF